MRICFFNASSVSLNAFASQWNHFFSFFFSELDDGSCRFNSSTAGSLTTGFFSTCCNGNFYLCTLLPVVQSTPTSIGISLTIIHSFSCVGAFKRSCIRYSSIQDSGGLFLRSAPHVASSSKIYNFPGGL